MQRIGTALLSAVAEEVASFCEDRQKCFNLELLDQLSTLDTIEEEYSICLNYDDINTAETVITTLISVGMSRSDSERTSTHTLLEGSTILSFPNSKEMTIFSLKSLAGLLQLSGLKVSVVNKLMINREVRVRAALSWLTTLSQTNDGMCRMVSLCLSVPILLRILEVDPYLSRKVAEPLHNLFLSLMADQFFKMSLGIAYAQAYVALTKAYGQGYGTAECSIFTLSVQFLNRETFVSEIALNHGFFTAVCTSIENMLSETVQPLGVGVEKKIEHILLECKILSHRRYNQMISDLKVSYMYLFSGVLYRLYSYVYLYICINIYIYINIYMSIYLFIYLYMYEYIYIFVCIYIYICIYMYIYVCIYILEVYIYTYI
jgi:hypothetical protein